MRNLILFIITAILLISGITKAQPWVEQTSGVSTALTSAYNVDDYRVWVCGYSGVVLKTTSGGYSWINVSGNGIPSTVSLINIFATDANNALTAGYIGSTNTYVYRTTNGGANWIQVFQQPNGFIDAIWMKSASNGFMYGDPVGSRWSLWKTTNSGANWDSTGLYLPQAGSEAGWNNALMYMGSRIWFGTNNTRIYYSTNDGVSWSVQSTSPESNSYIVWFFAYDPAYGLSGGSNLIKTSNYGINWLQLTSPGTGNICGISGGLELYHGPFSLNYVIFTRGDNKIYESYNGGTTWNVVYTAPSGNYRYISTASSIRGHAWAVRDNGGISMGPVTMGGIKKIAGRIPDKYSLSQNYPNPFNPVTKIKFDIRPPLNPFLSKEGTAVTLMVYDILGREVATLVNEPLKPGTYEVEWDGSNFSSGIYFYTLETGTFTQTKKMVLIK